MMERTPLTAAVSRDQGKTFPIRVHLREGPGSFAYPTAIQTGDDKIHVFHTTDDRTAICRVTMTESSLLSHRSP